MVGFRTLLPHRHDKNIIILLMIVLNRKMQSDIRVLSQFLPNRKISTHIYLALLNFIKAGAQITGRLPISIYLVNA